MARLRTDPNIVPEITEESSLMGRYSGADKSLARPERKQATATESFNVHISYV